VSRLINVMVAPVARLMPDRLFGIEGVLEHHRVDPQ